MPIRQKCLCDRTNVWEWECEGMGIAQWESDGNWNWLQNCEWEWEGMGIDHVGMGGNGNVKSHSRSSLLPVILTVGVFTARCTLVQSAVLRSHVVCLSVCLSVCNVGEL